MMISTFDVAGHGSRVWLTADLHFGHKEMLIHTARPWKNIDKHDNALIKRASEKVDPEDLYIIVGDLFIFGSGRSNYMNRIIQRLPGRKVLVLGNHDKLKPKTYINMGIRNIVGFLGSERGGSR